VDIPGCAPEYRRAKVREDFGVFLCGSRGQRGGPRRRLCGKFAGILQGEIRQRVSRVGMLRIGAGEGTMRSRLACDPWPNQDVKQHRRLFPEYRRDLRGAYGGIPQRLLGWPTP
jgi:hypothetical protein